MPKIDIFSDGASRGNPGEAGCGYVVFADGQEIATGKKYLGQTTNNIAEYSAVIYALKDQLVKDCIEVNFFLDSELVVKQMKGEYRVKNEGLIPLKAEIDCLIYGKKVTFTHVPRNQNKIADRLANEAIDEKA
ncbi:MAG: ribonuclease HI family protein [Deferribacterales bacterium]